MARQVKRGLLSVGSDKSRVIVQHLAIDQFGELPARKRAAKAEATKQGHKLSGWYRRPNDEHGRWNAFCERDGCTALVVVATEPPAGVPFTYGPALTTKCTGRIS